MFGSYGQKPTSRFTNNAKQNHELSPSRVKPARRRSLNEPTHIDLFSGIGGFALAAQWAGFRTIAFCEIDRYCQKVLAKNFGALADTGCERRATGGTGSRTQEIGEILNVRIANGSPNIHTNIFDFDGTAYWGCDLLTGGFPCQPFSVAGKRGGAADDRHLWPEMLRVIKEARPAWVLGENVPGIIPMELDNVLSDLEGIGYATRPFVIPACAVDARHRRDRLWIVCRDISNGNEPGSQGRNGTELRECAGERVARQEDSLADNGFSVERRHSRTRRRVGQYCEATENGWRGARQAYGEWLPEPDVGRVAHGIPKRVDRLKGLGNAIVPQVAYEILREIRQMITLSPASKPSWEAQPFTPLGCSGGCA